MLFVQLAVLAVGNIPKLREEGATSKKWGFQEFKGYHLRTLLYKGISFCSSVIVQLTLEKME